MGYVRNANFRMRHYASQTGELNLWLDDVLGSIETVNWFIDGEQVSKSTEYSGNISPAEHLVTVDVQFENGAHRTKSMMIDGTVSGHFIDDFTGFEQSIQNVIKRDYNWVVKVRSNGLEYSSLFADNSSSVLDIQNVEYYGLNSNGKKVYKIQASVNGLVRKLGTTEDQPISFNTTFGLEIAE